MGAKKDKSADKAKKKLAEQQMLFQQQEQKRLEEQRLQYEMQRQQLLATLAQEAAKQENAQKAQQALLSQQTEAQRQAQQELISQLQKQYDLQLGSLSSQLNIYKSLAGQAEKQQQYLNYLNTKSSVQAQQELEDARNNLLKSIQDAATRQGVLQFLASKRGSTFSPELVRNTRGGSISSYNLLR